MNNLLLTFSALYCLLMRTGYCGDSDWWKKTIIYQVYPRSFQDSNGDGIGDINGFKDVVILNLGRSLCGCKGITSRLDYIKSLGVDTLWLSPVYVSPMADFGYDIADHKDIDPVFGTLQNFDRLIQEAHGKDMYIVMDFVPNHTSDKHPWFEASRNSQIPYIDFYRWHDGRMDDSGTQSPPNKWLSVFSGSAWDWDEKRQQFYFHQFLKEQPDLNYRNPALKEAMEDVLRFWLDRGVDGFRVDAIQTLFEVEDVSKEEPRNNLDGFSELEYDAYDHPYTTHLDEIHEVVGEWRQVLNEYEDKTGKHPFMVMEVYSENMDDIMKYYDSGADAPFNFGFIPVDKHCGGMCFKNIAEKWMSAMPKGQWPNFVLSNHDRRRITTRKDPKYASALNTMLLLLPGTPTTYYGEEIGQLDIPTLSKENTKDPWGARLGDEFIEKYSRDPCRAPLQWSDDKNAGFSTADETWLPVHSGFRTLNIKVQDGVPGSTLSLYREAASLRRQKPFQNSNIQYHVTNSNIFSFVRGDPESDEAVFLVILNLGGEESTDDYGVLYDGTLVSSGKIVLSKTEEKGKRMQLDAVHMAPGDVHVIKITKEDIYSKSEL